MDRLSLKPGASNLTSVSHPPPVLSRDSLHCATSPVFPEVVELWPCFVSCEAPLPRARLCFFGQMCQRKATGQPATARIMFPDDVVPTVNGGGLSPNLASLLRIPHQKLISKVATDSPCNTRKNTTLCIRKHVQFR